MLWAGTEERGGIAEYLRVMQQTPLWATWMYSTLILTAKVLS